MTMGMGETENQVSTGRGDMGGAASHRVREADNGQKISHIIIWLQRKAASRQAWINPQA